MRYRATWRQRLGWWIASSDWAQRSKTQSEYQRLYGQAIVTTHTANEVLMQHVRLLSHRIHRQRIELARLNKPAARSRDAE